MFVASLGIGEQGELSGWIDGWTNVLCQLEVGGRRGSHAGNLPRGLSLHSTLMVEREARRIRMCVVKVAVGMRRSSVLHERIDRIEYRTLELDINSY